MCKLAKSVLNVFLSVVLALSLVPSFVHVGNASDAKGGPSDIVVNSFNQLPNEVSTHIYFDNDASDAKGGPSGFVVDSFNQLPNEVSTPTRPGYEFNGYWYHDGDRSVQVYNVRGNLDGTMINQFWFKDWIDRSTDHTFTIYAHWEAKEFDIDVTTNLPDGTEGLDIPKESIHVIFDKDLPKDTFATLPNCPGYKLEGIYYVKEGEALSDGNKFYDKDGEPIPNKLFKDPEGNGHFVVDFVKLNTVIFEENSPTGDDKDVTNIPENIEDMDIDSKLPESIFDSKHPKTKCSGYDFEGFEYSKKDMNNKEVTTLIYDDEGKLNKNADIWRIADLTNNTITLKAKWTAEEFDVEVTSNVQKIAEKDVVIPNKSIHVVFGKNLPKNVFDETMLPYCPGYRLKGIHYVKGNEALADGNKCYDKDGKRVDGKKFEDFDPDTNNGKFVVDFVKLYTITFDGNSPTGNNKDVSNIPEQFQIEDGAVLNTGEYKSVDVPLCNGYVFDGYYFDDTQLFGNDGETAYQEFRCRQDLTLVAHWKKLYTFTLNPKFPNEDHIEYGIKSIITPYGTKPNDLESVPQCTGHTFAGFYYMKESQSIDDAIQYFNSEGKFVAKAWDIANNVTLVAKWDAISYDVSFDLNAPAGCPVNFEIKSIKATYGAKLDKLKSVPKCTVHGFKGFYYVSGEGESKTEKQYFDAEGNFVAETWDITSSVTLIAKWTRFDYAYYLIKEIPGYDTNTLYFYGQENKDLEGKKGVIEYSWENTVITADSSSPYKGAEASKKIVFNESAKNVKPISCHAWFKGFKKCELIEGLDNLDTSDVSNMRDMFAYFACDTKIFPTLDLSNLNTANVVDMSNMFANFATNAQTALPLDLNCWDVSNVRTMSYMFGGFAAKATNAPMLYINKWSTNNVNDMSYMFRDFARESVVPAIIFAGDRFIQYQYGVISDDMFTGSHIRGGAGTTYDPTCVDADSACIDRQLNGTWGKDKGYFTDGSYIGKEFNIFFNAESNLLKDAVVSNKPNSITATFGNTLPAITTGIPTCTDHTFAGFYYVKGSGQSRIETQYYDAAGNPVEGIIWTIPSDATLVAKWQSNRHNIHVNFNAPPKEKATKIPDITVARDITLPTLKIKPVCKNYDFNGLSYKKTGKDGNPIETPYYDANGNPVGNKVWTESDFTGSFIAHWIPKTFIISLELNGGKIVEACDVKSYIYGEGAKLPGTGQITKAGYFFDGWYDNSEFKGCKYLKINNEASGNKKFYAKWKEVKYQLQFVDDDE